MVPFDDEDEEPVRPFQRPQGQEGYDEESSSDEAEGTKEGKKKERERKEGEEGGATGGAGGAEKRVRSASKSPAAAAAGKKSLVRNASDPTLTPASPGVSVVIAAASTTAPTKAPNEAPSASASTAPEQQEHLKSALRVILSSGVRDTSAAASSTRGSGADAPDSLDLSSCGLDADLLQGSMGGAAAAADDVTGTDSDMEKAEEKLHRRIQSFEADHYSSFASSIKGVSSLHAAPQSGVGKKKSSMRSGNEKNEILSPRSLKVNRLKSALPSDKANSSKKKPPKLSKRSTMPMGMDASAMLGSSSSANAPSTTTTTVAAAAAKESPDASNQSSPHRGPMNRTSSLVSNSSVSSSGGTGNAGAGTGAATAAAAAADQQSSTLAPSPSLASFPPFSRSMSMPFSLPQDVMNLLHVQSNTKEDAGSSSRSHSRKPSQQSGHHARTTSMMSLASSGSYRGSIGSMDEIAHAPEDTLDDLAGSRAGTPPSPSARGGGGGGGSSQPPSQSIEAVSERWKARLLKLRVTLSRAQGKNEALYSLLKQSNERVSSLSSALDLSKARCARLSEEVVSASRTGADLLVQLRTQTSTRRKDLLLKLQESEGELSILREEIYSLRSEQIEARKQNYALVSVRNDLNKSQKKLERQTSLAESWKNQMEESLRLVSQLQGELGASRGEAHSSLRKMKKRLMLKSIWFRTQVTKLERLQEMCMGLDSYLRVSCQPRCRDGRVREREREDCVFRAQLILLFFFFFSFFFLLFSSSSPS